MLNARRLALVGTISPVVFVGVVIVVTALEWNFLHGIGWHLVENSPIVYPSATAMGPYGLLQTVNIIQLGLGIIALGAGLWMTVRPRVLMVGGPGFEPGARRSRRARSRNRSARFGALELEIASFGLIQPRLARCDRSALLHLLRSQFPAPCSRWSFLADDLR